MTAITALPTTTTTSEWQLPTTTTIILITNKKHKLPHLQHKNNIKNLDTTITFVFPFQPHIPRKGRNTRHTYGKYIYISE